MDYQRLSTSLQWLVGNPRQSGRDLVSESVRAVGLPISGGGNGAQHSSDHFGNEEC